MYLYYIIVYYIDYISFCTNGKGYKPCIIHGGWSYYVYPIGYRIYLQKRLQASCNQFIELTLWSSGMA